MYKRSLRLSASLTIAHVPVMAIRIRQRTNREHASTIKENVTMKHAISISFATALLCVGALTMCTGGATTGPGGTNDTNAAEYNTNYNRAYFATSVTMYTQAPGQFADDPSFALAEDALSKLLGPPSGGGRMSPSHTSSLSLGMGGGFVILAFDPPLTNDPANIGGYDFIVFGNAYHSGASVWAEPGVVYVMHDANSNGEPDDTWYLIKGSHTTNTNACITITYSKTNEALLPGDKTWYPDAALFPAYDDEMTLTFFATPKSIAGTTTNRSFGYADCAPTLLQGDTNGDDLVDDRSIARDAFYTIPDTPGDGTNVDAGSGGGDAMKIEWAVDTETFTNVFLETVTWVKVVSAETNIEGMLGELSCEVDAIARVRTTNAE